MYVISGSTHQRLGASLAEEMDAEFCGVVNRHFPDGERYIRVLMDVARVIILLQILNFMVELSRCLPTYFRSLELHLKKLIQQILT